MPSVISVATEPGRSVERQRETAEHDLLTGFRSNVGLDTSQLFSFELFDELSRKNEKKK